MGFLNWWAGRDDLKKTERQKLIMQQLVDDNVALSWLAEARRDPKRWSKLRVLPDAAPFESFRINTSPTHDAS